MIAGLDDCLGHLLFYALTIIWYLTSAILSTLFVVALGCIFLKEKLYCRCFQAIAVFWCLWPDFSIIAAAAFPGWR